VNKLVPTTFPYWALDDKWQLVVVVVKVVVCVASAALWCAECLMWSFVHCRISVCGSW